MKLADGDRARIQAAIAAAEQRVGAHLSAVIVPASDRYALYPLAWAAAVALMAGGVLALVMPHVSLRTGIMIELSAFAVLALCFDWFPLRLMLVPDRIEREHAHAFARREFASQIMSAGERGQGVLFFVSLGERYVEILASREIHTQVGEAAWHAIIADFTAAAKAGRIADGTIAAVNACAAHLATHYPKSA